MCISLYSILLCSILLYAAFRLLGGCAFLFGSGFLGPGFASGLASGLSAFLRLGDSLGPHAFGVDEVQGVPGVEGILTHGSLSGGVEGNVNAAALGQGQGAGVADKHGLLCRCEVRVLLNGLFDLVGVQRGLLFFAETL